MATPLKVRVIFNAGRARSMTQRAHAVIRRARKRDRPALAAAFFREAFTKCARAVIE